jgi:hypothetical protein
MLARFGTCCLPSEAECVQEQERNNCDEDADASVPPRLRIQLDIRMSAVTKNVIASEPANRTDGFWNRINAPMVMMSMIRIVMASPRYFRSILSNISLAGTGSLASRHAKTQSIDKLCPSRQVLLSPHASLNRSRKLVCLPKRVNPCPGYSLLIHSAHSLMCQDKTWQQALSQSLQRHSPHP